MLAGVLAHNHREDLRPPRALWGQGPGPDTDTYEEEEKASRFTGSCR